MHQKFLFATLLFGFALSTSAQAASDLFPELQKKEAPVVTNENPEEFKLFDEQDIIDFNKNPEDEFKAVKEAESKEPLFKSTPKQEKKDEKDKKKSEQIFEIHPHNVQITIPPTGPASQFCTGQITLENKSDYPLVELKAFFTYAGTKVPYGFTNVPSNGTVTGQIVLLGQPCQDLLKTVPVEAEICKAEGISDSECKSMLRYILK